jgi:hypothetical protein
MVKTVFDDYSLILHDVENAIRDGKNKNELIELVHSRRILKESTRIELDKYTFHFMNLKRVDEDLRDFCFWARILIAGDPAVEARRLFTTQTTSLIKDLSRYHYDEIIPEKLSKIVNSYQYDIKHSFKEVTEAYYHLKIKLLK